MMRAHSPLFQIATCLRARSALTWSLMALAAFAATGSSAAAQKLTGRAITIIVPFTPGTGPDIVARAIGEELQQRWGQPVVIDNKPGASGNIGTHAAARAAPDGHMLLLTAGPFTQNLSLFKNIPYDPVKSFAPVIKVAVGSIALAVHPSVPATSTQEFVDYVKARPGRINYGSPGVGTPHHLTMELFKVTAQANLMHIPYKDFGGAIASLVGGHISAMFIPLHSALPPAQDRRIRLLGIASRERVHAAPELPTLAEQGLPGFEAEVWFGMLAPAGTPPEIVAKYNTSINEILRTPQVVERLARQGVVTAGGSPERFGEFIANDIIKWQKVVKEAGIAAE
jgi:tripartite-type tricarboxylate transporter receptor subunit TctC